MSPVPHSRNGFHYDWRYLGGIFLFVILWLTFFGYHDANPYDAEIYWNNAEMFTRGEHFSFLSFNSSLRGYLFSFLLIIPKELADYSGLSPSSMIIAFGGLQAALLFGWVLPALYSSLRPESSFSGWGRILFAAVGLFFWIGYFNYTLSDFPGLLAYCGALMLLVNGRVSWGKALAEGVLAGAALNMRPALQIGMPVVLLLAGVQGAGPASRWVNLRNVALVVGGMLLISLPQWQINRANFNRNTPLVLAQLAGDSQANLALQQVGWGLKIQKYESAFRAGPTLRSGPIMYRDQLGKQLLNEAGYSYSEIKLGEPVFESVPAYFRLVARHPLRVGVVYLAHLFNGLDQHYNTPYIRQPIQEFAWLLPAVNYSLWFGLLLLLWIRRSQLLAITGNQLLVLLAVLLPCAVGCVVATETRFLLPLHVLMYAAVCFDWQIIARSWVAQRSLGKTLILGCWVSFVALCFCFSLYVFRQQVFVL